MRTDKFLIAGIASCMLFFLSCSSKNTARDGLLPLSLSIEIGKWEVIRSYNFAPVFTTLTNNTSDTLRYISMSCSWQDVYSLDTNLLTIYPEICEHNVPELVAIPPHSQERKALSLVTEKNIEELKGVKFKVGFNWISAETPVDIYKKAEHITNNIVWSEPLQIQ